MSVVGAGRSGGFSASSALSPGAAPIAVRITSSPALAQVRQPLGPLSSPFISKSLRCSFPVTDPAKSRVIELLKFIINIFSAYR